MAQPNLSSLPKMGGDQLKKFAHFFNMRVLDLDFYGSPYCQLLF
jgi:hypothetical protein